ncbi:MAG: CoA ester lyase [Dehalococcoidia bacterium]|nr:CoA ester lyase [Dehalococcoidia bacterium]
MAIRTLLYAPGNEPRKVSKVGTCGADAAILDLEDAVAVDQKVAARDAVRQAIPAVRETGTQVYVRINPTAEKTDFSLNVGLADIEEVLCAELGGLVVPKVESAEEMDDVERVLAARERALGLEPGSVEVVPIIETALGLWRAYEIARSSPRIKSLHFGAGDFTRDVSIDWSRDEAELAYARSRLVVISRAAGIDPPTDSVWVRLDDEDGFVESAQRARRMGFQGKSCIHPRQVPLANRVFSYVSPEELAQARRIVEAFAQAQAGGSASIRVDGQFVDYPLVENARRVIELHAGAQEGEG